MAEGGCSAQDELWRDCAEWLTKWGVLRNDHRVNWPRATIVDLANTLRDGVLLCTLLSKIDPTCIDMKDVNLKPTMAQFLCLRNIDLFLRICVTGFGLKEGDLFESTMLFDLTNFHKVLCTLSKLSLTVKAQRSNICGFSAQNIRSRAEKEAYYSLKTLEMPVRNSRMYDYGDTKEEEIYRHMCSLQTTNTIIYELSHSHNLEKRDFVIKELIDTERNYTEVLSKLRRNFMKPLKEVLDPESHHIIFYKITELQEIHVGFLNQLSSISVDYGPRLSDIFLKWCKKFLIYASYCANLSQACSLLQEKCEKNEEFNELIIKYEREDNNGKFKLRDVLSVPMQRILKYHLLLEKLIENTEPSHEEYKDLKRAREAMIDVANYINEAARDSEHIAVLKKLQENIIDWNLPYEVNLVSYGRLVKDGEVKIKAHSDQRTKSRYVFIFDKAMFICKQLKYNQFAYRDVLNIADFHVEEGNNRATLNKEARWSYNWLLVKNDKSLVYTMSVRSGEIKMRMVNALKDAINNLKPVMRTNHKFEMHTFPEPQNCNHCSKYLKGLVYQGYKCQVCGISVHKDCIISSGRCGTSSTSTLPPPLPVHHGHVRVESQLCDKLWFAGVMDRNEASALLEGRENGTFLVRIRPQSDGKDRFALSLKTDNTVKHMKICCQTQKTPHKYYLSINKYFGSIEELVENYQNNSLKENFERLEENTKLEWPYKQILARVMEDYYPQERVQVKLREGEKVVIIGKEGYREGWWKIKSKNGVGFVPKDCLHEEQNLFHDFSL